MKPVFYLVALAFTVVAVGAQGVRWLRVLQREHYEPASVRRFFVRWAIVPVASSKSVERSSGTKPVAIVPLAMVTCVVFALIRLDAVAIVVAVAYGWWLPTGLSRKGRTSALNWTRRLKTVAAVAGLLEVAVLLIALATPRFFLVLTLAIYLVPTAVQFAAAITQPFENRLAQKFVDQATQRLAEVHPTVVAITGSFGKTSTKHHLAELLGGRHGVVPTPRSFNNRAGLSRAINENLTSGTTVFIAEMGTYGLGEIADLCSWCTPDIAVVTSIGPVHLERMGTIDVIEAAKYEITNRASTIIVNCDDARLAKWTGKLEAAGKRVVTAGSSSVAASVRVVGENERWKILRDGVEVAEVMPVAGVHETNLACAIAAAFELGADPYEVATRISHLTPAQHRLSVVTAPSGLTVIDDTFNANPASATSALSLLKSIPATGRRVVVTPGLIEMGSEQAQANNSLGRAIRSTGALLVTVARTNAVALAEGFDQAHQRFDTREEAVSWVRSNLGATDVVLYLNDLPDHYP